MDKQEILRHVDHTLLAATSTWEGIRALCDEAIRYETASVCIPPTYVSRVKESYGDKINICTVIGFPLGYHTTACKVFEAKEAVKNGAAEVDMVVNLGDVKNGELDRVRDEIAQLKQAVGDKVLKVIIETCYLTEEEKVQLCAAVTKAKADYIKTSTGFGTGGATMEDILLFRNNIGPGVKMKAAGGVRTEADMHAFLDAGCERLGTSSAVKILQGQQTAGY